jgi:hypothetical protein
MFFADRAREITEFCWRNGRSAFPGWEVPTLYAYVFFHVVDRTVFLVREHGEISAVGFMWGVPESEIRSRADAGEPVFCWKRSQDNADSVFMAELVGSAAEFPRLTRGAEQRFPEWWKRKKVFTFRRGKLVQLDRDTIERLNHGRR